ncbi:hypothetical protein EH165_07715 [Nakamurella antarctica]|uniref:Uncharacterized protein n=1 Tax=Nakamurella antarctica TaxID=1902245 RepID=A0A3G8ZVK3_9ACTN|nr:hypothetical protein [Nakamurella antarctica]AZI58046.1 hypothetical protein EH165_07715 [Nakamurella antarctica]
MKGPEAPIQVVSKRHSGRIFTSLWISGLLMVAGGTFAPWAYSGQIAKSSYYITGAVQRYLDLPQWVETLLHSWSFVGPACVAVVLIRFLGMRRAAAVATLCLILFVLVVSIGFFVATAGLDTAYVSASAVGPTLTVVGGLVAAAGAAAHTVSARDRQKPLTQFATP